jgi:hypothetical protein
LPKSRQRRGVFYRDGKAEPVQPLPDAVEPLGMFDEFWPEFSRFEMEAGDRLLLLTTVLARALPPDEPAASLALAADEALRTVPARPLAADCGAVLVAAVPERWPWAECDGLTASFFHLPSSPGHTSS